ncbi:MAG TPA: pantetheine-phosphate adenylyltransferase [Flavobacteriales bacterium]|nr:pantetheine-phosphate adenylyltransferase [Flavobacteriales bacterium]HIN74044.1 pantetheine-phosphate adenylyltransferase [Gammaproteobacteria bacterium]
MKRIAVFPGSFDPITIGHLDVVRRGLLLFDQIIIGIGNNSAKKSLFSLEQRMASIGKIFEDNPNVSVEQYQGLTIDFCIQAGANSILRGLRNSVDFEFEKSISQMNRKMHHKVETVFIMSAPEFTAINSTIIREIIRNGGDASEFVPKGISLSVD